MRLKFVGIETLASGGAAGGLGDSVGDGAGVGVSACNG